MNKQTVEKYLGNVDAYLNSGAASKEKVKKLSASWQSDMRATMVEHFTNYYKKLHPRLGFARAEAKAKQEIAGLAVLHQADKYAGGEPAQADVQQLFSFMNRLKNVDAIRTRLESVKKAWFGRTDVNSSIGRLWKDTNINELTTKARAVPDNKKAKTKLFVKLTLKVPK